MNEEQKPNGVGLCYRHFLKNVPDAADRIAKLTGVSPAAVSRWWKKDGPKPQGIEYIKVLFFLASNGYLVEEFEDFDLEVRKLMPIVALEIIPCVRVAELLGYSVKRPNDEVFDYFRPNATNGSGRLARLRKFNEEHGALFGTAIAQGLEKITSKDTAQVAQKLSAHATRPLTPVEAVELHDLIVKAAKLGERLISDESTSEDREAFREKFKDAGLHRFRDIISSLLSEQALKNIQESYKRNA